MTTGRSASEGTAVNRERRLLLGCSFCPPHRKENRGRRARHGAQKKRRSWK